MPRTPRHEWGYEDLWLRIASVTGVADWYSYIHSIIGSWKVAASGIVSCLSLAVVALVLQRFIQRGLTAGVAK